eukprot:9783957-Ditylum_brightwellii.AAC.1
MPSAIGIAIKDGTSSQPERCESELVSRKLLGLQNHLVVVHVGCPHAVRTTEAGMQNNRGDSC